MKIAEAFCQFSKTIFTAHGIAVTFQWRSGAAEQNIGLKQWRKINSCITAIISRRRIILFERRIMFFITNHQTQIGERKKDGWPGTENDLQFAVLYFIPDLHSFILWKFGMSDRYRCNRQNVFVVCVWSARSVLSPVAGIILVCLDVWVLLSVLYILMSCRLMWRRAVSKPVWM